MEIQEKCPNVPIILVGTKADLRDEQPSKEIDKEKCLDLAREIGAVEYHECSAIKNLNVQNIFERAVCCAQIDIEKKGKKRFQFCACLG